MFNVAFRTLFLREAKRFLNVYNQTIISPLINSILYFSVFTVIFAGKAEHQGFNYPIFVASGLIIMAMLQNSYANTQSSITTAKVLGFIVDFIIPPLSKQNILFAVMCAGIVRGILIGIASIAMFSLFVDFPFHNIFLLLFYSVFSCALFALIGIIVGSIAKTFDTAVSYNTYIIMPLTFLSGTFYSLSSLPSVWQKVILFNPVFYIIDGFRFAIMGLSDSHIKSPIIPVVILFTWVVLLAIIAYFVIEKKYSDY